MDTILVSTKTKWTRIINDYLSAEKAAVTGRLRMGRRGRFPWNSPLPPKF
jgi:hypothetical protein